MVLWEGVGWLLLVRGEAPFGAQAALTRGARDIPRRRAHHKPDASQLQSRAQHGLPLRLRDGGQAGEVHDFTNRRKVVEHPAILAPKHALD